MADGSTRSRPLGVVLLDERQRQLVRDYMPWALRIASVYVRNSPRIAQELRDAATMALCESASRHRAGEATFWTFAHRHVHGAVMDALEVRYRHRGARLPRRASPMSPADRQALWDLVDHLGPEARAVVRGYFLRGERGREIAARLAMSENTVLWKLRGALARLRRALNRAEHGL